MRDKLQGFQEHAQLFLYVVLIRSLLSKYYFSCHCFNLKIECSMKMNLDFIHIWRNNKPHGVDNSLLIIGGVSKLFLTDQTSSPIRKWFTNKQIIYISCLPFFSLFGLKGKGSIKKIYFDNFRVKKILFSQTAKNWSKIILKRKNFLILAIESLF